MPLKMDIILKELNRSIFQRRINQKSLKKRQF